MRRNLTGCSLHRIIYGTRFNPTPSPLFIRDFNRTHCHFPSFPGDLASYWKRWTDVFSSSSISKNSKVFSFKAADGRCTLKCTVRNFTTRNISGRLFYKRRPRQVPRYKYKNWRSKWLQGSSHNKGICVKVFVQTPRKPNSGLRKVARVRLSTGKVVLCYIPGMGHNLNVHSVVLVRGGRTHDVPGCNYKIMRGKYDLLPVKNRWTRRSIYAVKLPEFERNRRVEKLKDVYIETPGDRERFNEFLWMTARNPDGSLRDKPLAPDEPVPPPRRMNERYNRKLRRIEKKKLAE